MLNPPSAIDRGAAANGLVTVVVANFLYLAGLPLILDPMISMDSLYIQMAGQPLLSILSADPSWGPLYAVWLKPFAALLGDPVAIYRANLYCLSFAVSVMIYLYLLLLTRRAAVAVGAALFFLICDLNIPLCNKVSAFALMLVLAGLSASELVPAGARRMTVAGAGVLLASYVRPELYPAALFLFATAAWLAYTESRSSGRKVLIWPATSLAVTLILAFWIGTPLGSRYHDDSRLLIAFREHFAWNWSAWHNTAPDFVLAWEQEFGGAPTILQAVLNNPLAITHHLAANLFGTMKFVAVTTFDHYPLLAPATSPTLVKAENLLVAAAVIGSLIIVGARRRLRRQLFERHGHALVAYVALASCSVASAVAIFPVAHYLVVPGVLLMLAGTLAATFLIPRACGQRHFYGPLLPSGSLRAGLVAAGCQARQAARSPGWSWHARAVAVLVCLAAVPRPYVLPSAYVVQGSAFKARITITRPITDTIGFVHSLKLRGPVQVLTFADGIGELLGGDFHEVKIWRKGAQPLDAYIRDNDVGMIISLGPGQESVMVNDRDWNRMRNDLDAAGFVHLSVPDHDAIGVYVRTDLMQRRGG